ncbi:MAG: DUF2723 domain-containing protein, partial [Chloroflexi bacterium]|nr:DUF2723 domain-containing protein [Chloroflexota bacterium]
MGKVEQAREQVYGWGSLTLRGEAFNAILKALSANKAALALLGLALLTRLPLLSISLDEVDSANFYNALVYGYDITQVRPHAPGYPIYIFLAWLLNAALDDPLLSLTLVSAILGALTIVPFYLLLRELVRPPIAVVGSLLFLVNPLYWSVSESALSDVPSMFFVVLMAWLAYRGRRSNTAFLLACVAGSLAIGVRQSNVAVLPLLAFPIAYRALVSKELSWRLSAIGAIAFAATTLAWFVPTVYAGASGFSDYFAASSRQYDAAVRIWDFTHVESPWLPNVLIRIERFFFGYYLTYPWAGNDARTPLILLLVIPWLFGFGLWVVSFRLRDPRYVFTALWMASLLYTALVIHFLPRYALAQLPGFAIAALLGYQFLIDGL